MGSSDQSQQQRKFGKFCKGLALLVIAIGGAALFGWLFGVEGLKRIYPSLVAMKANTAVGLILAGFSLFLLQPAHVSARRRNVARVFALLIALLGFLTLMEHLFHWDFGLDQLLFHESVKDAGQSFPGRMGVAACLNFIFFGLALFFLDTKIAGGYWGTGFSLAAASATFLVFLYYFYGVEEFEPIAKYATIALHTALAFWFLCAGVFLARPDRGIMATLLSQTPATLVARRLLPAGISVLIFLGWLRTLGRRANFYGPGFGTAAFVLVIIIVFAALIWWVTGALQRVETSRLHAQGQEHRVQHLLRVVTSTARVGLVVVGRDYRYLFANEAYGQVLGLPPEDIVGKRVPEVLKVGWPQIKPRLDLALAGERVSYELTLPPAKGSGSDLRWFDVLYEPHAERNGETSVVVVVADVTERKQSQDALAESERFSRTIIESSRDCVKLLSLEGVLLWMSATGQKILCIGDVKKVLGTSWIEFWHGDDRARAQQAVQRAAAGASGTFTGFFKVCEEPKWWEVVVSPIVGSDGMPEKLLVVSRDVTERKASEDALRESEGRFRALAENIPQLAWMADEHGWIVWYNQRWFDFTGTTPDEMQGWGWEKVHHPEHLKRVLPTWKAAISSGEPWEDVFPLRAKAGHYRWFLSRAFPIRNHVGAITRWFGTNTDITDLRETQEALTLAQRELQQHATGLEKAVADRTLELRDTIRELEAFSYSLSHDLRAPLRSIHGFTQLVLSDYGDGMGDDAKRYLNMVVSSAGRMDRLIQDVLSLTQVSRQEISLRPIDVEKLVREIIAERHELNEPSAQLSIDSPLLPMLGHEAFLTQCITNLLANAVKFVAAGTVPKVRISSERRGGNIRLWVVDNGIGIDHLAQKLLFGMFQRVSTGEQTYEGTGIGLAIVRRAVERMNGAVGVESEPGHGSRFWIELAGT